MPVLARPDLKNLGRRLRQARSNARMTQSDLGRHLDVTKQLVSHWETGRCDITRERLVVLSRLLRVDVEWLAQGTILEHPGAAGSNGADPHSVLDGLAQLGQKVSFPRSPELALLERVPNPHHETHYVARFTAPEFTALCPVTGQPDFAHIVIDYVPDRWLIESKSLKLYLASFRNHGAFHEDCTVSIGKRLAELIAPHFLRIGGYWYPRGGIPIDVFWQTGAVPTGVWLPDQGVSPYRGRG